MLTIAGIDPGAKGGVAFWTPRTSLTVHNLPVKKIHMASGKTKTVVDEDGFADLLRTHTPTVAWVEDVYAQGKRDDGRGDGVVGAFSFGQNKGTIIGVLGGLAIPRQFAYPSTWKSAMGVTADKAFTLRRAQLLFPRWAHLLTNDGKAEAALIALYGSLTS